MPRTISKNCTRPSAARIGAIDDDAWIVELQGRAPMAQLATVHDGQPFINSNLFAYDEAARRRLHAHRQRRPHARRMSRPTSAPASASARWGASCHHTRRCR